MKLFSLVFSAILFANFNAACLVFLGWAGPLNHVVFEIRDNGKELCHLYGPTTNDGLPIWLECLHGYAAVVSRDLKWFTFVRPGDSFQNLDLHSYYGLSDGVHEVWKLYANNFGCNCDGWGCEALSLFSAALWLLYTLLTSDKGSNTLP